MDSTGMSPGRVFIPTEYSDVELDYDSMTAALRKHWPEYLMEAGGLALFVALISVARVLIEHPMSPLAQAIESVVLRRVALGVATGASLAAVIYSPWSRSSGGHLNPAVTLAFLVLAKMKPWDALFYVLAQFAGGIAGAVISQALIGDPLRHGAVNHAVTVPGPAGMAQAFYAEALISMVFMCAILLASRSRPLSSFTPLFAGGLLGLFVVFESALSGASLNPARTLGPAIAAQDWTGLWIYFTAPAAGMVAAALLYRFSHGPVVPGCAKLWHGVEDRCIFCESGNSSPAGADRAPV